MKYQVKLQPNANPNNPEVPTIEQDGVIYHDGDIFEPPANWKVAMVGFEGNGIRFAEPYLRYDEEAGKMVDKGDWRFVILPLEPFEEPEPAKKAPKGG